LGLSAKVEAKTEIPSEAAGRVVHALMDAISPFTETLGLVGDSIRTVRARRTIERLEAAQQRLIEANRQPEVVPDSFLIPWSERTSQDEGEDGLSDIWVNLLTSASANYESRMKTFPAILSELTGEDVRFLDGICIDENYDDRQITFSINKHLRNMQASLGSIQNPEINATRLKAALDTPGSSFFVAKSLEVNGGPNGCIYTNSSTYDDLGAGLSVMEKNGLLISFTEIVKASHIRLDITYVKLTRLGFDFVQAARGVPT